MLGGDSGDDAIIACGFRNPYRISIDSTSGRLWIGDAGWNAWEEIDTVANPLQLPVANFGWPCYEGGNRQDGYEAANLP